MDRILEMIDEASRAAKAQIKQIESIEQKSSGVEEWAQSVSQARKALLREGIKEAEVNWYVQIWAKHILSSN